MLLEPDRDQIEIFADAMFRHAASDGYVSLRSFIHNNKPFQFEVVGLNAGLRPLFDAAQDRARRAAQASEPVVFCPPVATFSNTQSATEKDVHEGLALSVELDSNAQRGLSRLEEVLGPATVVVRSGGVWTDKHGVQRDKLHAHWRLAVPARGADQLEDLKLARTLAARLVGGDPSNMPIVHPIRWPGSWHRKGEPRLCEIGEQRPDNEIDLGTALAALKAAAPARKSKPAPDGFDSFDTSDDVREDWTTHIKAIVSGERYQPALVPLSAKLATSGMSKGAIINMLRGVMESSVGPRNDRWQARYDDIPRIVDSAVGKYGPEAVANDENRTRFVLRKFSDIRSDPEEIAELIKDLIPRSGITVVWGEPKCGKTFKLIDITMHIARGVEYRGRRTQQTGVVPWSRPRRTMSVPSLPGPAATGPPPAWKRSRCLLPCLSLIRPSR
jgi:AAA domain